MKTLEEYEDLLEIVRDRFLNDVDCIEDCLKEDFPEYHVDRKSWTIKRE